MRFCLLHKNNISRAINIGSWMIYANSSSSHQSIKVNFKYISVSSAQGLFVLKNKSFQAVSLLSSAVNNITANG